MSVVPNRMMFCRRCGAKMEQEHRPAGTDGFYGFPVYQVRRRCPNRTRVLDSFFTRHDETVWGERRDAKWFGLEEPS